jgi:hypothetical protein
MSMTGKSQIAEWLLSIVAPPCLPDNWKLAAPGKVNSPRTANRRKGPAGDGIFPHAEPRKHATTVQFTVEVRSQSTSEPLPT